MKFIYTVLVVTLTLMTAGPTATAFGQTKTNARSQISAGDQGWPRKFTSGSVSFSLYQPQVDEWIGNDFSARAAFAVAEEGKQPVYGVLWFTARTGIDKVQRLVTFSDFQVTRINFPSAPEKAPTLQALFQARATQRDEVIALDRLIADMAINEAAHTGTGHEVKNEPPQIIFSTRPAILILIDGNPELRPIKDTKLERVINTRVLLVRDPANRKFYLHLMDGWMEATEISGPWVPSKSGSDDLAKALGAAAATKQVDLLEGPANGTKPSLKEAAKAKALPNIYVGTGPAELLQTEGDPQIAAIEGTQLVYVTNTENDIFVNTQTQDHYVLVAGRWFKSQSMNGPWQFVPAGSLPQDFARIPPAHPKASVLVSVPGTTPAKEALIANSIPQTATITRKSTTLTVNYDGAPRFKSIATTPLEYAVNTVTPVIRVDSQSYYAVHNGVWFVSTSATGPWQVATSVPAVIYSIPVGSALHYVTYVKIYGSTPETVYVGYTPGYYGTVVSSSNVVVYGTGYYYPPYVSDLYWYGSPYTYGTAAAFTWGVATGWGLAYGTGYYWSSYYYPAPWWGPVGYGGAYYRPYGYGGVAATSVYGQWGNVAYSGTRAAWANPYTGNVGRGGAVTGYNTATGTRYAARGGTNTNVYTGTTVTGGGAIGYNPNTGRIGAGQAGSVSNAYTGNAAAGTRGVNYNPQTGVISGGSVGAVKSGSTGQVTAGGRGFAYNTNTNTGVAVGNNNVYASKNGDVYRYNSSTGVQQRTDGGWQNVQRSQDRSWVQNQNQARSIGQQRSQTFGSMRSGGFTGGTRSGGFRGLGGGGGGRLGGRRR